MQSSPMSRSSRLGVLSTAGLAAVFSFSTASHAQVLAWNNAAGGSAGTAANWNPVQIPTATSILNFNLAGNYAVSFPATVPTSSQMNFNFGTVSLSCLAPHTATAQLVVGLNASSTPAVSLTDGTLSSSIIVVGGGVSSAPTLNVSGPTADLRSTGASGVRIGSSGSGTLNITNGGSLLSNGAVTLALLAGSQGTVLVSGLNGITRSELITSDPSSGDLFVSQNGTGSINIAAGGLVDIADDAFIAPTSGFTGSITVGSSVATDSTFDATGNLHIGSNLTAAAAGTGTMTINNGGTVTIDGTTQLGDSAGGTGTLIVREGGTLFTQSLAIDNTHGLLSLLGGSVFVRGGTFTAPNNQLTLNGGPGESPQFTLLNGAQCTLSASAGSRAMTIGTTRQALFSVSTASSALNVTSGDIMVGDAAGSSGILQAQNNGAITFANSGTLTLGNSGNGQLLVGGAGHVTGGSINVGALAGGTGTISIANAQATLDLNGSLTLGGTINGAGGTGTMTIGNASPNSGTVNVTGASNRVQIFGGSLLTVNSGGLLTCEDIVFSPGQLTLAGGTITAPDVILTGAAPNVLTGTINGRLQNTAFAATNLTGPLTVQGLVNDGAFSVGNQTLTITTISDARVDNVTLGDSGRIVAPLGLRLNPNKVLSGDGTIDANVVNAGTITATGTGLTLNGIVTGLGQGMNGTAIEFGPTGGFTGQGSFSSSTSVLAQEGSVILATGDLTMGNPSANNTFNSHGRIDVAGNSEVILRSGTRPTVHDVAFLNGDPQDLPRVRSSNGIIVDGLVTGTGIIGSGINVACSLSGATLSPGSNSESGSISFSCDTFMGATTRTEIDIFDASTHDKIQTFGNLVVFPTFNSVPSDITLGGTLVLRVAPGHVPANGETHQIVDPIQGFQGPDGFVNGNFATIEAPRHWIISVVRSSTPINPNGVFATYCTADFNEDSSVDFFDYLDFVDAFSSGDSTSDFNNDGSIDFFDYLDFVDAFSTGC